MNWKKQNEETTDSEAQANFKRKYRMKKLSFERKISLINRYLSEEQDITPEKQAMLMEYQAMLIKQYLSERKKHKKAKFEVVDGAGWETYNGLEGNEEDD